MTKFNELDAEVYTLDGVEYKELQDPYTDGGAGGRPYYKAMVIDNADNEYLMFWDVYDYWEKIENEDEMCDWENPASVRKI